MKTPCPICKKSVPPKAEHAPFCSGRCRDVDLGSWLGEGYRISRPIMPWEAEQNFRDEDDGEEER